MKYLPIILTLFLFGCSGPASDYTQIGYFKDSDQKSRYYTFKVASDTLDVASAKDHASTLMHTDGGLTVGFYYKQYLAPNITTAADPVAAALDANPELAVWHYPSGEIKVILREGDQW